MTKVACRRENAASAADAEDTDGTEPESEEAHALLNDMLPISASAPYVYTAEAASGSMTTLSLLHQGQLRHARPQCRAERGQAGEGGPGGI